MGDCFSNPIWMCGYGDEEVWVMFGGEDVGDYLYFNLKAYCYILPMLILLIMLIVLIT